ncbi:hypothetical protein GGI20_005812 [Coemansia sp. BCRC 34301]|nr:hypothetical protein GGI20_005812 [Coemansia sp. BCRC 34301]
MRLKDFKWEKLLPYDRGDEDTEFERAYLGNLKLYLLSGDNPATSALLSQLDGNYDALSLQARIDICRILYELTTTQKIDLPLFGMCCTILGRILE